MHIIARHFSFGSATGRVPSFQHHVTHNIGIDRSRNSVVGNVAHVGGRVINAKLVVAFSIYEPAKKGEHVEC
jgi:hypothetical protein